MKKNYSFLIAMLLFVAAKSFSQTPITIKMHDTNKCGPLSTDVECISSTPGDTNVLINNTSSTIDVMVTRIWDISAAGFAGV